VAISLLVACSAAKPTRLAPSNVRPDEPRLRPSSGEFVELKEHAWLYPAANETSLALSVPPKDPKYPEPRGTYRVTATGNGWLELETLTGDWKSCTVSTFQGMELRLFVRERDVLRTLHVGEHCDPGPKVAPGFFDGLELRGASAKVVGAYENKGYLVPDGICPNCVVEFRVTRRRERIGPALVWPDGTPAGTTTENINVLTTRMNSDGRACFELRDRQERPVLTRSGTPTELCVASDRLEKSIPGTGPGRLPRYLVNSLLPRSAVQDCLAERAHVSFVVHTDGSTSEPQLARGRAPWTSECVTRAIEAVSWPRGFAKTSIGFYEGGAPLE
jgi:hypothetical protein